MNALINIKHLTIGYKNSGKTKVIYNNINGDLFPGELTCVLGPNGAGKSTLLRTLCGFQAPLDGDILINGHAVSEMTNADLSKLISVVLTDKINIQNITVEELVSYGRSPYTGYFGRLSDEDKILIHEAIESVGIIDKKDRLVQTLSDGERQKVMIAKALVQDTPIIFLDEPAAFLDLPSKVELMQLLHKLTTDTGKLILIVTHDLDLALQMADKIWLLGNDRPISIGVPEDLIIQEIFSGFFDREGLVFDKRSGLFKIKNKHKLKINVEGHGFIYTLLRRALSRNGIDLVRDSSLEYTILINKEEDKLFTFYNKEESFIFNDIQSLLTKIKSLNWIHNDK